ncbi:hypothetical protein [Aromatoleum evansii]|uniref:Uncharacterized protein n=1 Tax=Aromatoleum evansii TaxID=59406 RepID=A0ABZ1ARY2_AROEV|nr:hypothetical protein [Aromatoleum evansii]NMG30866.1 hypothetical protein [Aromatoleum evansii]WRL48625.1 hypothetical protein U5817_11395 [Aromatoleum evansii]
MKSLKALAAALAILSAPAAFAGAGHDLTPKHGGAVVEVKEVVYELVATPETLTLYLDDHGRKVDTTGGSAKLTLLNGSEKSEATLAPAGDNKFEAKGLHKVASGTKAVAVVTLAGKAPATARFTVK